MHFAQSRKGFYTITENGKELILGPQYANAIRNDKRFNFYTYRVRVRYLSRSKFEWLWVD
jgi:hypothetical protein